MKRNMAALLDTNVIITYITNREDRFRDECIKIMRMCADGSVDGYMAFHSLSIVWYVLRKNCPDGERRKILKNVCSILKVASADQEQVMAAIERDDFPDFEDCLQDMCAQNIRAYCIVTTNLKDYGSSGTLAMSPRQFLERIKD